MHFISFSAFVYITHQMDELISASRPVVALIRPYTLGLIGFQAVFFFVQLQQNPKYKTSLILAYLPRLGIAARPNGKFGRVSGNSVDHFQLTI
jgi:hypothetical protein